MHEIQKKILRAITEIQDPTSSETVSDTQIAQKLGLDLQEIQEHLDLMARANYIQVAIGFGPSYSAWLTSRGRMILREPDYERRESATPIVNILTVIDSQIQNLAQTGNDVLVNQRVDSGLDDQILTIVSQMVEAVRSADDVDSSIKRDYKLEAEQLKIELGKSRPRLSRIRDSLSFLGDAEGTLGLAARVAPYLVALAPHMQQLIQSVK